MGTPTQPGLEATTQSEQPQSKGAAAALAAQPQPAPVATPVLNLGEALFRRATLVSNLLNTYVQVKGITDKSPEQIFGKDRKVSPEQVIQYMVLSEREKANVCSQTLRRHRNEINAVVPPPAIPTDDAMPKQFHHALSMTILLRDMADFFAMIGGNEQLQTNLFMPQAIDDDALRSLSQRIGFVKSTLHSLFRHAQIADVKEHVASTLHAFKTEIARYLPTAANLSLNNLDAASWQTIEQKLKPLTRPNIALMEQAIASYNGFLLDNGRYEDRIRPAQRLLLLKLACAAAQPGAVQQTTADSALVRFNACHQLLLARHTDGIHRALAKEEFINAKEARKTAMRTAAYALSGVMRRL